MGAARLHAHAVGLGSLGYMAPRATIGDQGDRRVADAKALSNAALHLSAGHTLANLRRQIFGQLCVWVTVSAHDGRRIARRHRSALEAIGVEARAIAVPAGRSAALYLIPVVVGVGSPPKMTRIAARGVVAGMKRQQRRTLWFSVSQNAHGAVRSPLLAAHHKHAIATTVNRRGPAPALLGRAGRHKLPHIGQ